MTVATKRVFLELVILNLDSVCRPLSKILAHYQSPSEPSEEILLRKLDSDPRYYSLLVVTRDETKNPLIYRGVFHLF